MTDRINSVVQAVPPVAPATVSATVFDTFKADPDLIAIAVVEQQRPVGLINRHDLTAVLATPYGRALFAGKPITLVMDPNPLVVPTELHIDDLEEMILSDNPQALAKGFILVHEDGSYAGIGSALTVLRSSVDRTIRRNRELEQLREEAEAANRAKSQFIAHMSHEIRTPMNAVIGLARLAMKRQLDSQLKDYLGKIYASASMLLGIINDILDFSKIEAGKLSLEAVEFDLEMVIDGVASTTAIRASEKDLEFLIALAPDVPTALVGDPLRLGQVLLNLINNAIKFTDRGEVELSICVGVREVQAVELEFSIRDTGIGMTEEEQSRLFRSFSQGDASMTRRYGGTGLGLAISKALTELMRGSIRVQSRPRAGSTFSFSARFGIPTEDRRLAAPARLEGLRVLVIDDSAGSRQLLGEMLARWSIERELAASGPAGLEALACAAERGVPFDLVLLDWRMPGMDGIETARRIKESRNIGRLPPIVLLAGYGQEDSLRHARRFGVKSVLAKPINKSALLETIQFVLGRQRVKPAAKDDADAGGPAAKLAGARILLVEDNDINCQIAVENLTSAGMVVEIAQNGRIALETLRAGAERFDAVLMDVQMPEMDGLEATRLIRGEIGCERLPIIAMTAHALEEERRECLAAGMDDHIAKPFEPANLVKMLDRWVKREPLALPAPVEAPGQAPAESVLPEALPGFDIPAALERVNGNAVLLDKLLREFLATFGDAAVRLRQHCATGEREAAERLAHTLGSVSGSLEAGDLHLTARELERALRAGDMDRAAVSLGALEPLLDAACATLRGLGGAAAPALAAEPAESVSFEPALTELRRLLAENNLAAPRRAGELAQALVGKGLERQLSEMAEQMDRLDFRGAERTLESLTAELGTTGASADA